MISDFVTRILDSLNQVGMRSCAVADQKKRCMGAVTLENRQHFRRVRRIWAVVERKCNERFVGRNPPHDVWSEPFRNSERRCRLGPEDDLEYTERDSTRKAQPE